MKYIKLKIENTSIDVTTITLYSILENSTDTLPEGIKIISEEQKESQTNMKKKQVHFYTE